MEEKHSPQEHMEDRSDKYLREKIHTEITEDSCKAKHKGKISAAKPMDLVANPSRKNVLVRLEPSLNEKLAIKRAVADELEDKLQHFRLNFNEKLNSSDYIKQELKRRETQLLLSVEKIGNYLHDICSLKRKADTMLQKSEIKTKLLDSEFVSLSEKNRETLRKKEAVLKVLESNKPAKTHLENIVYELPRYRSMKDLVEYFLILEALRKDLIEEDKKFQKEEERIRKERQNVLERTRSHPINMLAKESIVYNLKSETKDIRSQNTDLDHQVDNAISAKVKEDLAWYDMQRWINKVYESICAIFPPEPDEPSDTILDQLQKLADFVTMGTQLVERLKQRLVIGEQK